MQVEIDMSGRVEETSRHTVVAMANKNFSASVSISSNQKKALFKKYKIGKPNRSNTEIRILIFTDLLVRVIKPHLKKVDSVIIDTEYTGYEPVIKNRVLSLLNAKLHVSFSQIGKESPAHILALNKFRQLQFPKLYPKQKPGSSKKK